MSLQQPARRTAIPAEEGPFPTSVRGVILHRLPDIEDFRGRLSFGETPRHIPFAVHRYFLVFQVPREDIRGEHAHRTLHQFLICIHGSCRIIADDGRTRQEFVLDEPFVGLHLPPMTWAVQYRYSAGAVLLALTSAPYDPGDYIRDYAEFLAPVQAR